MWFARKGVEGSIKRQHMDRALPARENILEEKESLDHPHLKENGP